MAMLILKRNLLIPIAAIVLFHGDLLEADRECMPHFISRGYTDPKGDILIEYGNPLDIICVLNDNRTDSTHLKFIHNNEEVPSDMIEIVNSSSIRLHIEKPQKTNKSLYTCKVDDDPVCMNTVFVGNKPLPVTDFECIGYNYDNLTCSWTPPENYVKTDYNLTYSFPARSSRYGKNSCGVMTYPIGGVGKMSCFWNVSTYPQYRHVHADYIFTLTMSNPFGTNQMNKTFKHFQNVLPGPPVNLTYLNITSNSILLHWYIPYSMQSFPYDLHHRVLYQCVREKHKWFLADIIKYAGKKEVYYNLTGLKYAHTYYDIRVSMRSSEALPNDESMWSKNASLTVSTSSTIPGTPPKTNTGSFEIVSAGNDLLYREAYIYWQQIPDELKNGDEFTYNVSVETDSRHPIHPVEIKNAYARFKNLSITSSYKFIIWSQNTEGQSKERSHVYIPPQYKKINEPQSFTKIAFGDGRYELTWEPPKDQFDPPVTNYTIFWCSNERDRPYQCDGQLNWIEVPSNLTVYNVTVAETIINQFAISANTERGSSGMLWASCTVIHNKNIGKMKTVWISRIGSTFIEVSWKLECSDRIGRVNGFIIYYCPIVSPSRTDCKGPQQNVTILTVRGNSEIVHGNITDLTPYTTYMLTVAVITKHTTFSQQSDPLFNTTLEAAPSSPPLNVIITEVTNSSISLSWQPPNATNGIMKYYEIKYNNMTKKVDNSETKYVLQNLTSFQKYYITVQACTILCSEPSKLQVVTTKMGYPGKVGHPSVTFQNNSYIVITWDKPANPRGKIDVYDVRITEKLPEENKSVPVFNVTTPQHSIENCGDDNKFDTFLISVRAVNIIEGKRYEGPWSDELESYCRTPPTKIVIWILIPLILFGVFLIVYISKRVYLRWQIMRNVEVKLPPGLAPVGTTELVPWAEQKGHEQDHNPEADEELLLVKMGEIRQLSGDSSGCSSGHESVSSSLDTATNLSGTSDSGTEQQPPCSPTGDEIRRNSLRKRPVNKGYVVMPPEAPSNNWASKSVVSGNYCILGEDPSPQVEPEIQYSPISGQVDTNKTTHNQCDASSQSPYVMTGDIPKSINPGYVPYNTQQQQVTDKNPTYVLAGNKNLFVPELLRRDLKPTQTNDSGLYAQVSDGSGGSLKPDNISWQQPSDPTLNKTGYVSIGTATSPKITTESNKSYVPHRHYDSKSFKED